MASTPRSPFGSRGSWTSRSRNAHRRRVVRRWVLQQLEERTLLSTTYTVINTADTGDGSLRWAIQQVNADTSADADTIAFSIPATDPGYDPATGAWTIRPTSPLP